MAAVVAVCWSPTPGRHAVDTKPQLYLNPDAALASSLSAWQPIPALGPAELRVRPPPPALLRTSCRESVCPAWLIMRPVRIALVLVGVVGAARLRQTRPRRQPRVPARGRRRCSLPGPPLCPGGRGDPARPVAVALLPWALGRLSGPSDGALLAVRGESAAGLLTLGMAGQNAGSVVVIQLAVAVPVIAWSVTAWEVAGGCGPRSRSTAVTGLVSVALSAYWLLPTLAARSSGTAVVAQSESGESISAVSSWAESRPRPGALDAVRARAAGGAWVPAHTSLLNDVPSSSSPGSRLVAAAWGATRRGTPQHAANARSPSWSWGWLAMVGCPPVGGSKPLRAGLKARMLKVVPALGVFRTTNKAAPHWFSA